MATRARTTLIVVHVTATPPTMDIGAAEVDRMHRARGFNGIGYHFIIRRDGRIETGRPVNDIGAHVAGWNSVSIGVSLVGGVDARGRAENNRTEHQMVALVPLLKKLCRDFPDAKVCGHRDLSPDGDGDGVIEPQEYIKECPCFDAIPWARKQGLPAAAIRGYWDRKAASIHPDDAPDLRTTYLQKLLARSGYAFGPCDGYLGPKTAASIRQYQTWAGLPVTGAFDEVTAAHLRARYEKAAA